MLKLSSYEELRSMIGEKEINKMVENLKKYEEVAIILFVSYVTNKAKPISDVDIAIV